MPFQMIECMVALGGDTLNIVPRGPDRPVSYPEMLVLQYIHGSDAVSDAFDVGMDDRDNADELSRLRNFYPQGAIKDVFPGNNPRLPSRDARIKPRRAAAASKRDIAPSRDLEPVDPLLPMEEVA